MTTSGVASTSGGAPVASVVGSGFKTAGCSLGAGAVVSSTGAGRPLLLTGNGGRIAFPICYKSRRLSNQRESSEMKHEM